MGEERRFDVRVPLVNTTLLSQLAAESEQTGIVEARLLVLYATRYVESSRNSTLLPLMAAPPPVQMSTNGPSALSEPERGPIQASLGSDALDTLFGEPD